MEEAFRVTLKYLLETILATSLQLALLLGPLLVLALCINLVAMLVRKLALEIMGEKVFVFGFKWLGTPVHELGHAIFAILFFHKITAIKLFDPKASDGTYGYVQHSFRRGNIYQETGGFFIGIGPVLMGAGMLFLLTFLLFGFNVTSIGPAAIRTDDMTNGASLLTMISELGKGFVAFSGRIIAGPLSDWWKVVIFIYLLFSIGSSVTLSPADLKGAGRGFLFFLGILFIFNLVTLWIGPFATKASAVAGNFFSRFYFLMVMIIIFNAIFALLLLMVKGIIRIIKGPE